MPTAPVDDEALLAECRVETFRAGGPGGQHQNTTESGVRLVHLPTGVRVLAREERSQHRNRAVALRRLREKLAELARVDRPRRSDSGSTRRSVGVGRNGFAVRPTPRSDARTARDSAARVGPPGLEPGTYRL
jgi:protein subunit release factor A